MKYSPIARWAVMLALPLALAGRAPAADSSFSEKKKLYDLLEDRKRKFGQYVNSLDEKTGLFGSRTRSDIRRSMAVLKEIVETDNRIIAVLNRAMDFKVFEKSKMNYDLLERDEQLNRLNEENGKLRDVLAATEADLKHRTRMIRLQWLVLFLLVVLSAYGWYKGNRHE